MLCVCVHHISLGGEGNALYPVLSSYYCCIWKHISYLMSVADNPTSVHCISSRGSRPSVPAVEPEPDQWPCSVPRVDVFGQWCWAFLWRWCCGVCRQHADHPAECLRPGPQRAYILSATFKHLIHSAAAFRRSWSSASFFSFCECVVDFYFDVSS